MPDSTGCRNPECVAPVERSSPTGPIPSYCSKRCRQRAEYLRNRTRQLAKSRAKSELNRTARPCAWCSEEFTPSRTAKQKYCSTRCAKAASNAAYVASKPKCSVDGCENKSVARGLCRKHHPTGSTWKRGNPDTRRAALRRKTQMRRARLHDADAESIDRDTVGVRDGWKCGLCFRRIDKSLAWPHPDSPSLDHIVPLSLGGLHTYANVQIAHLTCNVAKGNRGGGEQLLLIG